MKRNILLLLGIMLLLACSSRKSSENKSVGLKGFSAYYNTLFNGKDALETELNARDKAYKDNFYDGYIRILTHEDEPLGTEDIESDEAPQGIGFGVPPQQAAVPQQKGATILEIAEAKALKAISKYSVMKNGEEKNKMMFDANILLAQARIYQDKPLEALDALNYIFSNMKNDKRLDLAKIYQAQAYAKMKDYYKANEVFLSLNNLPKKYERLKTIYYSQMLVDAGKNQEAVAELEKAFTSNSSRKIKSRIAFLRGQVLASLGKNEEARDSFTSAYKLANDFEFEVKSQIEIAKTFNGKNDDYEGAKKYIEGISKKGTYASRKNEFYYALGLMAQNAGKEDEAKAYFQKALNEKMSDPQMRGLTYYEIGKSYLNNKDYLSAGSYYDSAVAVMTYEPTKTKLAELSTNIKKIKDNFELVKKNDSILALAKMSEGERNAYFTKYIAKLKAEEDKKALADKKSNRTNGFETGDYNPNSLFAGGNGFQDYSGNRGGFYFANQGTVSKGEADFRQIWGGRALQDNWRYSATMAAQNDPSDKLTSSPELNSQRFAPEYYISQIPKEEAELAQLKKNRDTASLGLGRMYERYFSDTPLATKTLYDLADSKPEDEIKLQALYEVFSMNYERNPAVAERAKSMILSQFPYTSYAEFVKNPKQTNFTTSSAEVVEAYKQAFNYYSEGKFEESKAVIEASLSKYPKDALVPKFALLNAYNAGKTAGKEIMILQLEQLALNYKNSPEGDKAKSILNYMKSDLKLETTNTPPNVLNSTDANRNIPNTPPSMVETAMDNRQAPKINTTENVIQPMQNTPMPTSPPVKANDPFAVPNSLPSSPVGSTFGVPDMPPTELQKIKNKQ